MYIHLLRFIDNLIKTCAITCAITCALISTWFILAMYITWLVIINIYGIHAINYASIIFYMSYVKYEMVEMKAKIVNIYGTNILN